jgi:hypothetical protein
MTTATKDRLKISMTKRQAESLLRVINDQLMIYDLANDHSSLSRGQQLQMSHVAKLLQKEIRRFDP